MTVYKGQGKQMLEGWSWFDRNWMFVSIVLGVITLSTILTPLYPGTIREKVRDIRWLGFFLAFLYSTHQFEEHAFDVRGWRYMFVPTFNAGGIATGLGLELDPRPTTYINMIFIWLGVPILAYLSDPVLNANLPTLFCWGIAVINGLSHLASFSVYMPGALQSGFMCPMGVYVMWLAYKERIAEGASKCRAGLLSFNAPLFVGVLFHVVIVLPGVLFPDGNVNVTYPIFLILGCAMPYGVAALLCGPCGAMPGRGKNLIGDADDSEMETQTPKAGATEMGVKNI